jgi:endoglucanase
MFNWRCSTVIAVVSMANAGCVGVSAKRDTVGANGVPVPQLHNCPAGVVAAEDGLIDDFEDGNTQIAVKAGRGAYWFKSADSNGSEFNPDEMQMVDGGSDHPGKVLHVSGTTSGAQGAWGVLVGANFVSDSKTYDASRYVGISFRAKIGKNATSSVRFKMGDINTHPDLGICTDCWNHFGKDMSLTTEWKEYQVLFTVARQEPYWGNPKPDSITPGALYSMDFTIKPGQKFDLWVDDVQFLKCVE